MRVLLDCRMALSGGIGRYTTGLARALAARDDVELLQVCPEGRPAPVTSGVAVQSVIAGAHPFGPRGAVELAWIVRHARPDVVHCPHFPTPVPATAPLVVTLHDLAPLRFPGVMPSGVKRIAYRAWNSRAAREADVLVVPSRWTAGEIEAVFPKARGKLRVIAEAADDFSCGFAGPANPAGPVVPAEFADGSQAELVSGPYLLSMGNTRPHKDLPTLLRAFALLAPSEPDLRLLLVGPRQPGYVDEAIPRAPAEIRGRVTFTGRVDDTQLQTLYAGAVIFVFPSRYEGFGLPPLEAMASGVPVVCADAASLPEVIGSAGVFFPAGDAPALCATLAQVMRDGVLRQELRRAGRERAALFSWARAAEETAAVYRGAIASHARGRRR
jgi:glycosyltransferase involved in cell wall biosynthesis